MPKIVPSAPIEQVLNSNNEEEIKQPVEEISLQKISKDADQAAPVVIPIEIKEVKKLFIANNEVKEVPVEDIIPRKQLDLDEKNKELANSSDSDKQDELTELPKADTQSDPEMILAKSLAPTAQEENLDQLLDKTLNDKNRLEQSHDSAKEEAPNVDSIKNTEPNPSPSLNLPVTGFMIKLAGFENVATANKTLALITEDRRFKKINWVIEDSEKTAPKILVSKFRTESDADKACILLTQKYNISVCEVSTAKSFN
jgi:hypothetical protein